MQYIEPCGVDIISRYDRNDDYIAWDKDTIKNAVVVEYLIKLGYYFDDISKNWYKLCPEGYYLPSNEIEIKSDIFNLLRSKKNMNNVPYSVVRSIVEELSSTSNYTRLIDKFSDFVVSSEKYDLNIDVETELIPCRNGLFNRQNGEILGHCGYIFNPFEKLHNFDYEKLTGDEINYSVIEDIYREIIPDDATRYYYFAWLGRVLFSNNPTSTILIIYGRGGTGKTSLSLAIRELLGHSRCSSIGFNQITDKFAFSGIIGKKLNVMDEIETGSDSQMLERTTILKQITGGDSVKIEGKYEKAYFTTLNANVMIIGNSYPKLNVADTGLMRRLAVIECNNRIKSGNLHEEITTNDALNWLWNKVYAVWNETKDDDLNDIMSLSMIEDKNRYLHSDESGLNAWISDYVGSLDDKDVQKSFNKMRIDELYQCYIEYCRTSDYSNISRRNFTDKILIDYNLNKVKGMYGVEFRIKG